MKRSLFVTVFALLAIVSVAQKPVIEFNELRHDFGTIAEDGGKVTHTFEFTNTGAVPLVISNVKASCGCTTPNWTKEPVEPGQKGTVTATYNPMGRPGGFTKTINVTSNAEKELVRLTIEGTVTPKQNKPADKYPVKAGVLGLRNRAIGLSNINYGERKGGQISLANLGDKPVTVGVAFQDKHVKAVVEPSSLQPNGEGVLKAEFVSEDAKLWGPFTAYGQLVIDGKQMQGEEYRVVVSGNIVEDFSKMNEQEKRNAPICELSGTSVNLGTIKKGSSRVAKFRIANQGPKTPLVIRRLVQHSSDIVVKATKMSLAPGKKADINIIVNTADMAPKSYKSTITLITNDPNRPNTVLSVGWTVED